MSFASSFLALASSEMKTTRSARFLTEMLEIIPWEEYLTILKPYTKPAKTGRPRKDTRILLKMYFLQQWYGLSDEATEDAVYDRLSFQKFLDINLSTDTVPDSTTLEDFRHLLETHKLSQIFFEAIQSFMQRHNLVMKKGTSVDATIIEAPSSTKNQSKKRDPEMRSTKKGNDWYFGMKVHTGTDIDSKTAHTIHVTSANIHDSEKFEECLHGEEKAVFADKAYHKKQRKQNMRQKGIYCGIIDKASRGSKLSDKQQANNHKKSSVRSKTEHIFHVVKNIFGYKKVRYRGLAKNTNQVFSLFTLANLYLVRKKLKEKLQNVEPIPIYISG